MEYSMMNKLEAK